MEWINDVMGSLSDCVSAHDGVLVDYIGDELLAMWGAPKDQPDHAPCACRAAIDMLDEIPVLNQRWAERGRGRFDLGIGINTGPARVGNTGTKRKFKYGPLGNAVNLACRLQGATKYFKTRADHHGPHPRPARRQHRHPPARQDPGRQHRQPVEIFELAPVSQANWDPLRGLRAGPRTLRVGELLHRPPGPSASSSLSSPTTAPR